MVTKRKIPMRMCVACREMKPKKELRRVVKSKEGEISVDFKGKAPGRGAYLCVDPQCLAKAKKTHALEKALETSISEEIYAFLASEFLKEIEEDDEA